MKNTFGNVLTVSLFGESHGKCVGALLDGLPAGIPVSEENIKERLLLRRPFGNISTPRVENDEFSIESGVYNGYTTGTPICITVKNENFSSKEYEKNIARPGHSDYTAFCKYHGFEDYRGGGHFSGRVTAALVAVGSIVIDALAAKGMEIKSHIVSIGNVSDKLFDDDCSDIIIDKKFPTFSEKISNMMKAEIEKAKANGDSVGGVSETAILGVPKGIGEPWFDTVEGLISHGVFSIPAVKGVEFGKGFAVAEENGSIANDEFIIENGEIKTKTNNCGGVLGGITNGMPIVLRCAVKPTPSIAKTQNTVNFKTDETTEISISGKHDPCIVHRAIPAIEAICAISVADMLETRFGTDYLA